MTDQPYNLIGTEEKNLYIRMHTLTLKVHNQIIQKREEYISSITRKVR